jgi:predicted Fe-Mo cluster-binding NifX family protein
MGIKVYRAMQGTVKDNIGLFQTNTMVEISIEHACGGHAAGGGCGH